MTRPPGMSARVKLTLSYAGFLMLGGVVLLALVWIYLLRFLPNGGMDRPGMWPNRGLVLRTFVSAAGPMLLFLLVTMLNTYGFGAGIRLVLTGVIIITVIVLASGRKSTS